MTRSVSVGVMVQQLAGLLGTGDINAWEQGFIETTCGHTNDGKKTSHLSEKQVENIENLWRKHFA